jgi:acyl-CoA synthetase (AMP-forming)/AMP-acid ligase II
MGQWLMEAIASGGHRLAFIDGVTGAETSYAQLHAWVRAVEAGLHSVGCAAGDVAASVLSNCAEYAVIWAALLGRGAVLCGVNPAHSGDEMVRQLRDCGARLAFADVASLGKVRAAAARVRSARRIFVVCSGAEAEALPADGLVAAFHCLRTAVRQQLPPPQLEPRTAVATLLYSSGTSGLPKGVQVTHYGLAAFAAASFVAHPDLVVPSPGERLLLFLPFFHVYGLVETLLLCLLSRATVVTVPRFHPRQFLRLIQEHRVSTLFLIPPTLVFLAKAPETRDFDLSSLRLVSVSAAPIGRELITEFVRKFPHVEYLVQSFGMTECMNSMVTPTRPLSRTKFGSCGVLYSNFEACVVELETGLELVRPGQRGELWLRSPTLMSGYHGRPGATAATVDQAGWLHTGDVGYVDSDGYWYVVDRIKELIKVKGFQVAPAELEDLLLGCAGVADAAVVGVPHPRDGEVPRAFVVKHPGSSLTEAQVTAFVEAKAAPYKQLKGGVKFLHQLPKSPSGKILRRLLRDLEKAKL